jgi:hypothetical protein
MGERLHDFFCMECEKSTTLMIAGGDEPKVGLSSMLGNTVEFGNH